MKTPNYITEISESDFRKLNIKVYTHERVKHDGYTKFVFVEKSANDIIDEEIAYFKGSRPICTIVFAVHIDPPDEVIQSNMATHYGPGGKPIDIVEAHQIALNEYSYLDKFMNRFTGARTFQIACDPTHIYSTRDYWELHEDYWRVRKDLTKAIYLIHIGE